MNAILFKISEEILRDSLKTLGANVSLIKKYKKEDYQLVFHCTIQTIPPFIKVYYKN